MINPVPVSQLLELGSVLFLGGNHTVSYSSQPCFNVPILGPQFILRQLDAKDIRACRDAVPFFSNPRAISTL